MDGRQGDHTGSGAAPKHNELIGDWGRYFKSEWFLLFLCSLPFLLGLAMAHSMLAKAFYGLICLIIVFGLSFRASQYQDLMRHWKELANGWASLEDPRPNDRANR